MCLESKSATGSTYSTITWMSKDVLTLRGQTGPEWEPDRASPVGASGRLKVSSTEIVAETNSLEMFRLSESRWRLQVLQVVPIYRPPLTFPDEFNSRTPADAQETCNRTVVTILARLESRHARE